MIQKLLKLQKCLLDPLVRKAYTRLTYISHSCIPTWHASGTIQYSDFMRWYQNYETLKECESETKNSDDLAVYNNQGEENIVNKERSASAVSAPSDVVQTLLRSGYDMIYI